MLLKHNQLSHNYLDVLLLRPFDVVPADVACPADCTLEFVCFAETDVEPAE